jgi:hypothetical protein
LAVNNAAAVVCTNSINSLAVACEAGFYVSPDGNCAGMGMIATRAKALACFDAVAQALSRANSVIHVKNHCDASWAFCLPRLLVPDISS